jgi:hypothetical protein
LAREAGLSYKKTSCVVVAWVDVDFERRVMDLVGWEGKIDAGVA